MDVLTAIDTKTGTSVQQSVLPDLIREGVISSNSSDVFAATRLLRDRADDKHKVTLIRQGLAVDDWLSRSSVADCVESLPKADKQKVVAEIQVMMNTYLTTHSWRLPHASGGIEQYVAEPDLVKCIENGFTEVDDSKRRRAAKLLRYCSAPTITKLIKQYLPSITDGQVRSEILSATDGRTKDELDELQTLFPGIDFSSKVAAKDRPYQTLFQLARPQDGNEYAKKYTMAELIASEPLSDPSQWVEKDGKLCFRKTDSIAYTLRGRGDNTIVNRVSLKSFRAWQAAYGDTEQWSQVGLDHVPIVPILDYRLYQRSDMPISFDRELRVDVLSARLRGVTLRAFMKSHEWYAFADEVIRQQQAILDGLDLIGVQHGHLHNRNIMVVPQFDHTATVVESTKLYAIDFDMAFQVK